MKKGWPTKTLGEVCEVFADGDWVESKDQSSEGIRLIQTGNVGEGVFKDRAEKARYISEATFKRLRCTEIVEGDCLVSRLPDPVGRSCILPDTGERMITAVDCTILRFNPKQLLSTFFNLYSQSDDYLTTVAKECTGTTRNRISRSNLGLTPIPVPPLAEQQRIVGLLDEAFEGLATAKANAEKNLQNARSLFESHLQSVFTQRGPGWVETTMEEVADADCSLSYGIVQPGEEFDEGMPIVRPTDLTTKVIRLSGLKRIDPKLAGGYKRTALQGGELLLCVRGSTGTVSIASPELVGANVTRGIVPIRFNRSLLMPEFGFYLISGGPVQSQIREKTYGTALMQINIRDLRLISLSIPPLKEQKTIAAKLDSLHEETQRLARLYERKLAALEALKKALLHQAFAGEL
jgi:type I restriction enzyme, S subunit